MDYAEAKKRSDEVQSDLHSCCFFDVNTLVFVSKSRCVRGSVAVAEVSVRLSLCAVHRPFLLDVFYTFCAAKLQKIIRKSLGETKKKVAEGKSLKLVSVFG